MKQTSIRSLTSTIALLATSPVALAAQANPATRLQGIGASLDEVGERLGEIDIDVLIASVNQLGPRLVTSFEHALDAIRNEIVALLESLQFATGSASASASVSVG